MPGAPRGRGWAAGDGTHGMLGAKKASVHGERGPPHCLHSPSIHGRVQGARGACVIFQYSFSILPTC